METHLHTGLSLGAASSPLGVSTGDGDRTQAYSCSEAFAREGSPWWSTEGQAGLTLWAIIAESTQEICKEARVPFKL